MQLLHALLVDLAAGPGAGLAVIVAETLEDVLRVVVYPLPYGPLLGVQVRIDEFGPHAIARTQDVLPDRPLQRELLPSLLRVGEEAEPLRQRAERLDRVSRRIAARTAGAARHALAAVPDRVAAEQFLDRIVVARLDRIDDLARIVAVELRRRTDARADAAVHAGRQTLLHANVFHQHIEIFPHLRPR